MAPVRVDKLAFTLGRLGTSQDRKPTSLPGEAAQLTLLFWGLDPARITLGCCMNLRPFHLCGPLHKNILN